MQRASLIEKIDEMVEENRAECLWFLREDFLPIDDRMRLRALEYIQRYGNRGAALKAAELTRWLLRFSSDTSAGS